jgi:hypothetical protein
MNLLMRVKLLDAKQAALEAKMVAAEMRNVARSSTEAGIAGDRSARGLGKNFGRGPALCREHPRGESSWWLSEDEACQDWCFEGIFDDS